MQAFSLFMILVACTGIFLPLEVALNQAWGVKKSRNYIMNQTIALGLALVMVLLAVASIYLNLGEQAILGFVFFHHTDNWFYNSIGYVWLALSPTGVASILFFFSIYWILPQSKCSMEACAAYFDLDRNCLAAGEADLCGRVAASESAVAVWAVLCFSRTAVLGVRFRADLVCRCAVQRGTLGERKVRHGPGTATVA